MNEIVQNDSNLFYTGLESTYVFDSVEEAKDFYDQLKNFEKKLYEDYAEFQKREKKQKTIQKVTELLHNCDSVTVDDENYLPKRFLLICEVLDYMILDDGLGLILEHPKLKITVLEKIQDFIKFFERKEDVERMNIMIKYDRVLKFLLESKVPLSSFFI